MCDNEGLFEGALVRTKEAGQTGGRSGRAQDDAFQSEMERYQYGNAGVAIVFLLSVLIALVKWLRSWFDETWGIKLKARKIEKKRRRLQKMETEDPDVQTIALRQGRFQAPYFSPQQN